MKCWKGRSRARVTPQNQTAREININVENRYVPYFFAIPGHNAKSGGVDLYIKKENGKFYNEYSVYLEGFPTTLIYLDYVCPIIATFLVTRPHSVSYPKQCNSVAEEIEEITKGKVSYGCNGHVNYGAEGSETLVRGTQDNFDDIFGDILTDELEKVGIKQRHKYNGPDKDGNKYISDSHNGAGMLKKMYSVNCLSVIIEPCSAHDYYASRLLFDSKKARWEYFRLIGFSVLAAYYVKGFIKIEDIRDLTIATKIKENYTPL